MKTTVNNGKRTALFWFLAATFFLSLMAHGAGAAKFGTLRNSDWVVTNAWIAASNRVDSFVSNYTFRVADDGTNYADFVALYATNYANWVAESATNYANSVAESSTNYTDSATNALAAVVDGKVSATNESRTAYIGWDGDIFRFSYGIRVDASPIMLPSYLGGVYFGEQSLLDILDERSLAATNYTDASISTNNAAFVAAVLAAPIVGASPSDLADIAEYGSYGTVGAAILALIAGLAALKRDKANKTDLPYPFVTATVTQGGPRLPASAFPIAGSYNGTAFSLAESDITIAENESTGDWMVLAYSGGLVICVYTSAGAFSAAGTNITNLTFGGSSTPPSMEFPNVLIITPRTVATFTATSTQASFTVAVGAGTTGAARDCVLVVDGTASGAAAPSITWPSNFHPRTDVATDMAICADGNRCVFYISEYAPASGNTPAQYVVGGWVQTDGGSETQSEGSGS